MLGNRTIFINEFRKLIHSLLFIVFYIEKILATTEIKPKPYSVSQYYRMYLSILQKQEH